MELIVNIFTWAIIGVASTSFAGYAYLLFKDAGKKRQVLEKKVVPPFTNKTETRTPLPEYETTY